MARKYQTSHAALWGQTFSKLAEFKAINGHCNVSRYGNDSALGDWVTKQRRIFRLGKMPRDRVARLNAIGFRWALNYDVAWEANLTKLKSFAALHGHCIVPHSEGALGSWVATQRETFRVGRMPQDRVEKLEAIGFQWRVGLPWDAMYQKLVAYRAEFGTCNVPAAFKDDSGLHTWVCTQRTAYKRGQMDNDRIIRLEGIGFCWDTKLAAKIESWENCLRELAAYKSNNGHCNGEHYPFLTAIERLQ